MGSFSFDETFVGDDYVICAFTCLFQLFDLCFQFIRFLQLFLEVLFERFFKRRIYLERLMFLSSSFTYFKPKYAKHY